MAQCATATAGVYFGAQAAVAAVNSTPTLQFPSSPRDRIAVASYSFREFITGSSRGQVNLQDFAGHVMAKFKVNKIEPWSAHFPSTDPKYLEQFRTAVEKAGGMVANIAVDGEHCPYSPDREVRDKAVAFSKRWVDVAAAIGSPSIRTNLPAAKGVEPDAGRTAESLLQVVEHAAAKNVVINLENDNPLSEDPFFLVKVVEKADTPWLHTLPDFGNTLMAKDAEYAYRGIDAMFGHAYCISHVKAFETNDKGVIAHVDMAKTFGFARQHGYKGYFSMEFDDAGNPYQGTAELIEKTIQYLS